MRVGVMRFRVPRWLVGGKRPGGVLVGGWDGVCGSSAGDGL